MRAVYTQLSMQEQCPWVISLMSPIGFPIVVVLPPTICKGMTRKRKPARTCYGCRGHL